MTTAAALTIGTVISQNQMIDGELCQFFYTITNITPTRVTLKNGRGHIARVNAVTTNWVGIKRAEEWLKSGFWTLTE